ncbi:MAG TPA: SDR family oxidoreductase [Propionibacteriaceae bacterium]|nr:SDR family oxidoreductase [Propionibacteriaceae bacterium]
MSRPLIAVTGVTGHVGGLVGRQLRDAGADLVFLARDPTRVPDAAGVRVERAGYDDTEAAVTALRGVDLLFMVSGSESRDRVDQHRRFIDAAARAGVGHVVYTSFQGAAPDATFTLARDHWATEQHLRASGMAWTFLRDSLYLDFFPEMVGADGVIRGPAGEGRVAAVARADVARVAASVLLDPRAHEGATYDVTGPEALSLDEVAEILTGVTRRPTSFHDETLDEAYASRASYGAPWWQVDAWVSTYTAIAGGQLSQVSDAVERLTGASPLSLEQLLRR